jgi:hypothetical protein
MNKPKTPVQAIRLKCLECSSGNRAEVRLCPMGDCPLYAFRMRRNPNYKRREVSEDQSDPKPQETLR